MDEMRQLNIPQNFVGVLINNVPIAILSLTFNVDVDQVEKATGMTPVQKGDIPIPLPTQLPLDLDKEMNQLKRSDQVEGLDKP
jgi:hypothetical protein